MLHNIDKLNNRRSIHIATIPQRIEWFRIIVEIYLQFKMDNISKNDLVWMRDDFCVLCRCLSGYIFSEFGDDQSFSYKRNIFFFIQSFIQHFFLQILFFTFLYFSSLCLYCRLFFSQISDDVLFPV